jgi:hypothetical protein
MEESLHLQNMRLLGQNMGLQHAHTSLQGLQLYPTAAEMEVQSLIAGFAEDERGQGAGDSGQGIRGMLFVVRESETVAC